MNIARKIGCQFRGKPYHFVKWSNPVEVVKVDPKEQTCESIFIGEENPTRKRSKRVYSNTPWRDYYIAITMKLI